MESIVVLEAEPGDVKVERIGCLLEDPLCRGWPPQSLAPSQSSGSWRKPMTVDMGLLQGANYH